VETPPAAGASRATEDLIAQKADAASKGESKTEKALKKAIDDQNQAEINTELRWLIAAGVLVCALGVGLLVYGAAKLGLSGLAMGATLIGVSLTTSSLLPYLPYFALAAVLAGIGALLWYLHKHRAAVTQLVECGEHSIPECAHVESIISKIVKKVRR
jgi:hypothetical protein